jgi:hypothetical protein
LRSFHHQYDQLSDVLPAESDGCQLSVTYAAYPSRQAACRKLTRFTE